MLWQFFLVALGGAMGASGRYGCSIIIRQQLTDNWPVATLLVNVFGSVGIGIAFVLLERGLVHTDMRALVVIGFFGAFTTFSTFSLELLHMLQRGEFGQSLLYASLSLISCVAGAALGLLAARAFT